jgi:hypothetical protein
MHATRGEAAGAAIACRSTRKTKAANVLRACNDAMNQSMMKDDRRMK